MADQVFHIVTLNDWLQGHGARRGDIIIDRFSEHFRYLLCRDLGQPGEVTGRILGALADGHIEGAEELIPRHLSQPPLQLVAGGPVPRARQLPAPRRRRWGR